MFTFPAMPYFPGQPVSPTLSGSAGDDGLWGAEGEDIIAALGGNDRVEGGHGSDYLLGGSGKDDLLGGDDDDLILGGSGEDRVRGGLGGDVLAGGKGDDLIQGEAGDDFLASGEGGHDVLRGGAGSDFLSVGHYGGGSVSGYGGAGDDLLVFDPRAGHSFLSGGAGEDALAVSVTMFGPYQNRALSLDMVSGRVFFGREEVLAFRDMESVHVGSGTGNDTVRTLGGNDSLFVGAGANEVRAGGGDDQVAYRIGKANWLDGGAGLDTLNVSGQEDERLIFKAETGTDAFGSTLTGFEKFAVFGSSKTDRVTLGRLDDTAYGQGGNDVLLGRSGSDWLNGEDSSDRLEGMAGDDRLEGGADGDVLKGGAGADYLIGGSGIDQLTGGAGADTFWFFEDEDSADLIEDFEAGIDRIGVDRDRIGDAALSAGELEAARFHEGAAVGSQGQFVLINVDGSNRLVWDANGTAEGGLVEIALFVETTSLTASDIVIT